MMRQLVCILAALFGVVAVAEGAWAVNVDDYRDVVAVDTVNHQRQLSSSEWSFTNLMYHLKACPEPVNCPGAPVVSPRHPCGCPDCSKPHPNNPSFAHGYCYVASSSASSAVEESYEDASYDNSTDTSLQTSQGSAQSNDNAPSANWIFNPLYYIVGGATVALVAAGIMLRKRNNTSRNEILLDDDDDDHENLFGNLSRRLGMLAATGFGGMGAAAAAAIGFGRRNHCNTMRSDASIGDLSGSVSRRMRSMEAGDDGSAPYYREEEVPPMFVNVPADGTYLPGTTLVEHPESVEVEGPYRPSSYSACV